MNSADAVAVYQLTSVASGNVYTATVYPCKDQRNGHIVDSNRIEWACNKSHCFEKDVPPPLVNAAIDAFHAGVYCAAFHGVDRI